MTLGGADNARRRLEGVARTMPWPWRLISALLLAAALIAVTDVLASAVSAVVVRSEGSWPWGQTEATSGTQSTVTPGLQLASVRLVIAISGDELTATYTVASSSGQALAEQAQAAEAAGNGDRLVNELLGQVSVAQFRHGFIPNRYDWTPLGFMTPALTVNRGKTTVTVESTPFQLLLGQQYLEVKPAAAADGAQEDVEFTYPQGLQVLHVAGASLISVSPDDSTTGQQATDLRRGTALVTATLREPGSNWTTGLRSVGGIDLPVGGGPLQRLASLVSYAVLLWSLGWICRHLPALRGDARSVVLVSRNAVSLVVGAIIALSALGFSYQLLRNELTPSPMGALLAGPSGLAVAGAVVLWPVLCWRVVPRRAQAVAESSRSWLDLVPQLLVAAGYLVLLVVWSSVGGVGVTWWLVALTVLATLVLVYLLGTVLIGGSDLGPRARSGVLAGLLAVVLGSTLLWPVLVYLGFYEGHHVLHVNVIGKWIYLAAALVAIAGLCVLTARVIQVLGRSHLAHLRSRPGGTGWPGAPRSAAATHRMWRRAWMSGGGAVLAAILAATVPSLIRESQIGDAHAQGLLSAALTSYAPAANLFRALPQLLNWLFLALAIAVLLAISRAPAGPGETEAGHVTASRVAARRLAIPVLMLILFSAYTYYYHPWVVSGYTWLYLPVTPLLGLLVLTWALPAGQATADRTLQPGPAIRMTLRAWRNADFAGSQRQQLLGNAEDLRKDLLSADPQADADRTFFKLARAQNRLAEGRDFWRRRAREHLRDAFDHYGETPDPAAARRGAIAGALLGLAPAAMLFLKTRPAPAWSGYPVLDFLGFTAWIVLIWPTLGWAMGYFLPFIRGHNGTTKALCVYVALCASVPMNLLWLDGSEWRVTAIYYLAAFAFLMLVGVVVGDLMALVSADLSPLAWVQAHNWQFLVTWSTAVIAAIGTATAAFLSTAATDLGQQTVTAVTGQSAPGSAPVHG